MSQLLLPFISCMLYLMCPVAMQTRNACMHWFGVAGICARSHHFASSPLGSFTT